MWPNLKKVLFYLAILQVFGQLVQVESSSIKKGGKGKAFGAGILFGGLAGAAVGHALSHHDKPKEVRHHVTNSNSSKFITPNTPSKPVTTIEKGETLTNGCYKQTIKQPFDNDTAHFTETEELVCPQINLPTVENQTFVHSMPAITIQLPEGAAVPSVHLFKVLIKFEPAKQAALEPPYTDVSVRNNTNNSWSTHPPTSVITGPPQVIVLSRRTGLYDQEKRNAANSLFEHRFALLLSALGVLCMSQILHYHVCQ